MSTNKLFKTKLLSVLLVLIFCLFASTNALSTKTKTLEGMKTILLQKLSRFQGDKVFEIKEVITQLIQISKDPDAFETYQRTAFDVLMEKVRELVDEMVEEQQQEDTVFTNTSNLLLKYHLRQEHALEMVQDKFQLMQYFIEFVESIEQTGGMIDVTTNYPQLLQIMRMLLYRYTEYREMEVIFNQKFTEIYQNLKNSTNELQKTLQNNQNPYKQEGMNIILNNLNSLRVAAQVKVSQDYLYNVNPNLEISMINKYITFFEGQSANETKSILPNFFPSFVEDEKQGKDEVIVLSNLLNQANESIKLTEEAITSTLNEYLANTKTRKEIINVIYQILDLINKRSKKIKGLTLKYVENTTLYFDNYENKFKLEKFKKYMNATEENTPSDPLPELPKDITGLEDKNAPVVDLENHVPLIDNIQVA